MPRLRLPKLGKSSGRHAASRAKPNPDTWVPTPQQWEILAKGGTVKGVRLESAQTSRARQTGDGKGARAQLTDRRRAAAPPSQARPRGKGPGTRAQLKAREGHNLYQSQSERYRGERAKMGEWPGQTGGKAYPSIHYPAMGKVRRPPAPMPRKGSDQDATPRTGMWRR